MVYLTRRETFNAAHKLYNDYWSLEQNELVFGKCSNKNWHGHNYVLYVTVKGNPDPDTGFIINVKDLSKIIKEVIVTNIHPKNPSIIRSGIKPMDLPQNFQVIGNTIIEQHGKGRHDPCVVPRAVPIVEAMAAIVLADFYLLNKIY